MDKPLSSFARLVLLGAGGLAVVVGPILYFFPNDTATYFAWTIKHPLTPVFMGAHYFAGIGNFLMRGRDRWSLARVQFPPIIVFAITMLIATLLHIPIFNWSHPVAWGWLLVYVVSPFAATIAFFQMERGYQAPDFESQKIPAWYRTLMIVLAVPQALVGLALFLFPEQAAPFWPWTLTPLTARVVGGWWLASVALLGMLFRQESLHTARIGLLTNILINSLLLVGVFLHFQNLNGPSISIFLFFLFSLTLAGSSAVAWLRARKLMSPANDLSVA